MQKPGKTARFWQNVIFLTLLPLSAAVFAAGLQSHASIKQAVQQFIAQQDIPLQNVQVEVTSLNAQVMVPRCHQPLKVRLAPGARLPGNTSLTVSCSAPQAWRIHVAARVDGTVNALVARYPLLRGTVINDTDLEYVVRRYSQLTHGYYSSFSHLKNMQARRNIKAGQVLTPGLLTPQKLVLRGQHITIVAHRGRLNLRLKGKALMDGKQGQTIRVQNLKSKKLIYARVVSSGMVEVEF